jgi:hypothetical protein
MPRWGKRADAGVTDEVSKACNGRKRCHYERGTKQIKRSSRPSRIARSPENKVGY